MAAMLMMLRCVVRRLLSPHPYVCSDDWTALMKAASEGHESIVRLLLEYRADVNAASKYRALAVADASCSADEAALCSLAVALASSSFVQVWRNCTHRGSK